MSLLGGHSVQCGRERGWRLINEKPVGLNIWLFVKTLDNKWNLNHGRVKLGCGGRAARFPLHHEGLDFNKGNVDQTGHEEE